MLQTKLWPRARDLVHLWKREVKVTAALIWWSGLRLLTFRERDQDKSTLLAIHQVTGDVLICRSKQTTTASRSCNGSSHLIRLRIIDCHSMILIHLLLNADDVMVTIFPSSFKPLMMTLISTIPPGIWHWFGFIISSGRGIPSGSHSSFLIIRVLTHRSWDQVETQPATKCVLCI